MASQSSASFTSRSRRESVVKLGEWFTCQEELLSTPFPDRLHRWWSLAGPASASRRDVPLWWPQPGPQDPATEIPLAQAGESHSDRLPM